MPFLLAAFGRLLRRAGLTGIGLAWFALALPAALAAPPFKPGERLQFSVSWAILPGAGRIVVEANQASPDTLKITTKTSTRNVARMLLPFEATEDAIYDLKTDRLVSLHERSNTRKGHVEHLVTFDYETRLANYLRIGEATSRKLEMPAGQPNDLITALLQTRHWDIKPGEKRDTLVIFNDDFYELTIHALRYEEVSTSMGRFRTLVLQPRMEKTPPKGMFKRGSTVQVWISQDERRLPVMFQVEFNIGTGVAMLEKYTPPTR